MTTTEGKKALVTGASGGIGRAFAQRLAKEGYQLTVVARNEAKLRELITSLGAGHRYIVADLSEAEGVRAVASDIRKTHYALLVNNAGAGAFGTFDKVPLEQHMKVMRLNCDSVIALSHAYLPTARSGDALINVSSVLGLNGFPYSSLYAASKALILSLSESLWVEMKERGIYVMALCPGATTTDFHEAAGGRNDNRPPKGIMQTAEDVVTEAMNGLQSRSKPTVICGAKNRIQGNIMARLLSRKASISLMGRFGSGLKSQ